MADSSAQTASHDTRRYAGFWIRCGAAIIDVIIFVLIIFAPLSFIYGQEYWTGDKLVYGFWDIALNYVLPIILTVWFWLRYLGTPGKMLLKLRVVDATSGNALSVGQAVGRYFAYLPAMLPLGLGLVWIAFDKNKQGWHDKLAGSVVLRAQNGAVA